MYCEADWSGCTRNKCSETCRHVPEPGWHIKSLKIVGGGTNNGSQTAEAMSGSTYRTPMVSTASQAWDSLFDFALKYEQGEPDSMSCYFGSNFMLLT